MDPAVLQSLTPVQVAELKRVRGLQGAQMKIMSLVAVWMLVLYKFGDNGRELPAWLMGQFLQKGLRLG